MKEFCRRSYVKSRVSFLLHHANLPAVCMANYTTVVGCTLCGSSFHSRAAFPWSVRKLFVFPCVNWKVGTFFSYYAAFIHLAIIGLTVISWGHHVLPCFCTSVTRVIFNHFLKSASTTEKNNATKLPIGCPVENKTMLVAKNNPESVIIFPSILSALPGNGL